MISVTLGTIPYPFDRAIDWIKQCLAEELICEQIFIQHGATSVAPIIGHPLVSAAPFLTSDTLAKLVRKSRLVISHAGQGSTRKLARSDTSFTIMPRQAKYGEHIDNHQIDFAENIAGINCDIHVSMSFQDLEYALKSPPQPIGKDLFAEPKLSDFLIQKYPGRMNHELMYSIR